MIAWRVHHGYLLVLPRLALHCCRCSKFAPLLIQSIGSRWTLIRSRTIWCTDENDPRMVTHMSDFAPSSYSVTGRGSRRVYGGHTGAGDLTGDSTLHFCLPLARELVSLGLRLLETICFTASTSNLERPMTDTERHVLRRESTVQPYDSRSQGQCALATLAFWLNAI